MPQTRFAIGIDLGTTNSALAYADSYEDFAKVRVFEIPQLKAPGEIVESPLLPSFAFSPDLAKLPEGSMKLPWGASPPCSVGTAARDSGCKTPSRFICSVKSWLCHPGVDRRAKILPWNAEKAPDPKSPVEVSRLILEHLRDAWNFKNPEHPLERQEIALTVPASFDESARELTLEAAQEAGLKHISVLEEPLAAFYAWLESAGESWRAAMKPGESALVVDVGGGTSDFSIIALDENGVLYRGAAGDHLLLGGDNIDMAIAREAEAAWGGTLPPDEWASLCQLARDAKERILGGSAQSAEMTLLSKGSSVIAGAKSFTLREEALMKIVEEGFLPVPGVAEEPRRRGAGIKRMGLPYESDPAITRHLLEFLKYASKMMPGAKGSSPGGGPFRPDKVLFNGGALIPQRLRDRILKAVASWTPGAPPPKELPSKNLSLAVAVGAAKAMAARKGAGVRIKSGTSRSYYVEVAKEGAKESGFLCVMPRGTDEGAKVHAPRKLLLEANKPVSFPLWSAHARPEDKAGDELASPEGLVQVSSLDTLVKFQGGAQVETEIVSELGETGTLSLSIEALSSSLKWPLKFDIRAIGESPESMPKQSVSLDSGKLDAARNAIEAAFAPDSSKDALSSAAKAVEAALELQRKDWPLPAIRQIADSLLAIAPDAGSSPLREARLLNLCGFCLRPGFGDCADPDRIAKAWKLWQAGLKNSSDPQAEAEWHVFWRRIAPGLRPGHQRTAFQELWGVLCPKGQYAQKLRKPPQVRAEMWRCIGSLELIAPAQKQALGEILAARVSKLEAFELWTLARLGTRRLFHGQAGNVVPASAAKEWLRALIEAKGEIGKDRLFAVSRIAALCGERALDLPAEAIATAREFLKENSAPEQWLRHLDAPEEESDDERAGILGDALPLGLKLAD